MIELGDALALLIVFLAIWAGHYVPWRVVHSLVDEAGELHRPLAYGYGCICILGGMAIYAARHSALPAWEAVLFLFLTMAAAGVGTLVPRLLGVLVEFRNLQGDVEDNGTARD
jgi:hypothetical protein